MGHCDQIEGVWVKVGFLDADYLYAITIQAKPSNARSLGVDAGFDSPHIPTRVAQTPEKDPSRAPDIERGGTEIRRGWNASPYTVTDRIRNEVKCVEGCPH